VNVQQLDDLILFSYMKTCQFKRPEEWNWFEKVSRGLVMDAEGEIVARPFDKFWNYGEVQPTGEVVEITEKMDGCFRSDTPLLCWDGSIVRIQKVVKNKLHPILMGVDKEGNIVPCEVTNCLIMGLR